MKYLTLTAFFFVFEASYSQDFVMHAHNDYLNERPLFGALENGFNSIEVDIYQYQGELKVSHLGMNLGSKPTLSELYLEPLEKYLSSNSETSIWLLIDLKQDDRNLLDLLHEKIDEKGQWFKSRKSKEARPIQIILSGAVQRRLIEENVSYEYFYLDGRIRHLEERNWDSELMPLISANFKKVVSWNGKGEMKSKDQARIVELVMRANAQGKKLRFWRTKDNATTWAKLNELGVPVVGTDDMAGLASYLK